MLKLYLTFLLTVLLYQNIKAQLPDLNLTFWGAKIMVPDMERAVDFYCNVLGFEIKSQTNYPDEISLNAGEVDLRLVKTKNNTKAGYSEFAQTSFVLQVNDLKKTVEHLKKLEVKFLIEIDTVGVGIAAKFLDPFGIAHSLLEQTVRKVPEFEEPKIYNAGYSLANISQARKLYNMILNFKVLTEKYFPPALPLKNWDNSFGFMLHENTDLKRCTSDYFNDAQTVLVFATGNINDSFNYFKKNNIKLLHNKIQNSPSGKYFAFENNEGVPAEIIEPK